MSGLASTGALRDEVLGQGRLTSSARGGGGRFGGAGTEKSSVSKFGGHRVGVYTYSSAGSDSRNVISKWRHPPGKGTKAYGVSGWGGLE